jgi:hypothetical protein
MVGLWKAVEKVSSRLPEVKIPTLSQLMREGCGFLLARPDEWETACLLRCHASFLYGPEFASKCPANSHLDVVARQDSCC